MKQREVAYVPFDVDVELSTPLEEIPQGDHMVYHLFSCWREGKKLHTHALIMLVIDMYVCLLSPIRLSNLF